MRALIGCLVGLLLCVGYGSAAVIVLDFEGLGNLEPIANFYNGGLGGNGSGPGPSWGITFGADSLAIIDADAGGTGNFANEPSPNTIAFFLTGSVIMNVPAGFDTGFAFFYTSTSYGGTVNVYSGLDATGTLLATLSPSALGSSCGGDPNGNFNCWAAAGVAFAGVAKSVDFGGVADQIGFDNVTLGSAQVIPEPASLLLLGSGLASVVLIRLRRRRS